MKRPYNVRKPCVFCIGRVFSFLKDCYLTF
nr:MAG TPA: restriction alleviation protein [Bacteriophage sp.]